MVPERGGEGLAKAMEPTGGQGSRAAPEAVGRMPAYEVSYGVLRPGGVLSRVDVPQYEEAPIGAGPCSARTPSPNGGPAPSDGPAADALASWAAHPGGCPGGVGGGVAPRLAAGPKVRPV
ncbi:hypothetical protein [Nocardiopsis sp. CNT312]|uniref:hypothetical protein n=1 Tax=Nocardiopsis sp. CNT312 TaxID=1137268 RepID=UPI0004B3757E|nr:hypothetical protein [Nocardiopsis sp. CNT312]